MAHEGRDAQWWSARARRRTRMALLEFFEHLGVLACTYECREGRREGRREVDGGGCVQVFVRVV